MIIRGPFPEREKLHFIPLKVSLTCFTGEYLWREPTWKQNTRAFGQHISAWFELLPLGSYILRITAEYADGKRRCIPHGKRRVSAPLSDYDMWQNNDARMAIMPGLKFLAKETTPLKVDLDVWIDSRIDSVELDI